MEEKTAQLIQADGRYEVQSQIASGGMGVVYRVRERVSGELQALKRIKLASESSHHAVEAFEREYQVLAGLDHPRIIKVFDYGVDSDGPFYTMELLEGQDMRRLAPLPYRAACSFLRDIATSLALLHNRRMLHRDLSPSNVRMTSDGHCKLLDFGALTDFGRASKLVGTPPLIAPEMLRGAALDQRADLYALGALAYWMLTGRHAFPVRSLGELPELWQTPPRPPSAHVADLPPELDELIVGLLNKDPLGRPGSAGEVIARLEVIGQLDREDRAQSARLAQSFFASPRYVGREQQLATLSDAIDSAVRGRGSALRIEAAPGLGRTRLLEEAAIRGRLAGATVLMVDASMSRQLQGTARALVQRIFELVPQPARAHSARFAPSLTTLGEGFSRGSSSNRPQAKPAPSSAQADVELSPPRPLCDFFCEISREKPLLIAVDNIEDADDASLGLLASIASIASQHPLLIVLSEARTRGEPETVGRLAIRRYCRPITLEGLSNTELFELFRSIFAEAQNLERFVQWLGERVAGSPLHAIEVCRGLLASGVLRYESGMWTLPADRPSAALPVELSDALQMRLRSLDKPARALAECLSLQRDQPTLGLCELLCSDETSPAAAARSRLDDLIAANVLLPDRNGYRFSSSALRAALLESLTEEHLAGNHRKLGAAFAAAAGPDDLTMSIEAGFHLIEGGDELRGASLIADVTRSSVRFRTLVANLYHAGRPVERAYKVFRKHRRSEYERMPLLASLAQLGYYEARYFGEQYGDEALDVLERISGLATARRLRRFLGNALALLVGVILAYVRFVTTPRAERAYSFREIFYQLFSAVTTLAGTAALSLDAERSSKVAAVLQPFAFLPERLTPVGIYQFCSSLGEIARENEVEAYATFEQLLARFSDPRYYPSLPAEGRHLYLAAIHFARGSFAVFRADGEAALQSAHALELTGLKLYAMIASQLRFLYYFARGEQAKAAPHRELVELHAAHMGSLWQVETWESAALLLIHAVAIGDIVGTTQLARRLQIMSREVPSLRRYDGLAASAVVAVHRDKRFVREFQEQYKGEQPRSYIGWAAVLSEIIRVYNYMGEFSEARKLADETLVYVTEADRELVALFVPLDIQVAYTDAGLGRVDDALARLDGLLRRFKDCNHPLLHGMLHEARAYICWEARRTADYEQSRAEAERWLRPTGTPALVAKCERLYTLMHTTKTEQSAVAPLPHVDVSDEETIAGWRGD